LGLTLRSRSPPPTQAAGAEPGFEHCGPPFVVGAGGQFADIVGGGVGLDAGEFAEIVDGVGRIGGTATDPQDEEPSTGGAGFGEESGGAFNRGGVDAVDDGTRFVKELLGKGHCERYSSRSRIPAKEPIS
jgi:hypothetical protein